LQFLESVSETANSSLYTFIGQPQLIPASAATDNVILQYSVWDGMIALKRINGASDVRSGIRKIVWQSGNVYARYDANNPNIFDLNFYVINPDDNNVYKCIANNNGTVSTVAPTYTTATVTGNVFLADSYKWKYMYTIDTGDLAKFGTPSFVPITANATVASQAVQGSILHINVDSGGNYAGTPTVVINGDGAGATATVNKSGTAIANVVITNIGSGYRFANITLSGGTPTTAANLRASIAPSGGHGKNALNELAAHYAILNTRVETTDTKFPIGVTYHQVGLVQDPTNSSGDVLYTSTLKAYETLGFAVPPSASQGNIISQATTGANAYVVGKVTGDTSNVIIIRNSSLTSNIAGNYANFATGAIASIGAVSLGAVQTVGSRDVALNSGKIIYVDNRAPISRVENQSESISIILEF
jgi:hypothetical protein